MLGVLWLCLAVSLPAAAQQDVGSFGGTLHIGRVAVGSMVFNPMYTNLPVEREIAALIYGDGLLRKDRYDRMSEGLATWPRRFDDGREWVFHLRNGIRFHDGKALSADDVVFTYAVYKQSRTYDPVFYRYFNNLDDIRKIDSRTVLFVMKERVDEFPGALATLPILPKHQLDNQTFAAAHEVPVLPRPIGLGAFKLDTWPVGDQIVLKANTDWYYGRPYLEEIVYTFYPTTEELLAAFIRREVDMVNVEPGTDFLELKRARPDAKIQAVRPGQKTFTAIHYNNTHPLLGSRTVRRALTHATDRNLIISHIRVPGGIRLAHSPIDQDFWAYGGAVSLKYDPAQALSLLSEAGWRDTDRDGVLDQGGRKLRFELLFPRGSITSERIVRIVKLNFNQIGVDVIPMAVEQKELVQRLMVGAYEAALFQQVFEPTPDDFYTSYHSESIGLGFNLLGYQNRQVDRNIGFLYGIQNPDRMQPIFQRLQELISEDQPSMFLYFLDWQYIAYDPRCKNIGRPGEPLTSPTVWYLSGSQ